MVPAQWWAPLYEAILGKPKILVPHPCGKASTSKIAGRREPHHQRKPISTKAGLSPPPDDAIHNRHAVATSLPLPQSRCSSACLCRCPGPDLCCRCQRRRQGPHCCLWPRWHLRHCSGTKRLLRRIMEHSFFYLQWQSCQLCNVPMLQTSRELALPKFTTAKMANPCVNF